MLCIYNAAKAAVYIIVDCYQLKKTAIHNVAKKCNVSEAELTKCVEAAIPSMSFAERSKKAIKRKNDAFYSAPAVKVIPQGEKQGGVDKITSIRSMLKQKEPTKGARKGGEKGMVLVRTIKEGQGTHISARTDKALFIDIAGAASVTDDCFNKTLIGKLKHLGIAFEINDS